MLWALWLFVKYLESAWIILDFSSWHGAPRVIFILKHLSLAHILALPTLLTLDATSTQEHKVTLLAPIGKYTISMDMETLT